jgi:hypothetical protein
MAIVELGQTVKDAITGYEGVVTSITEYLHACRRLRVQSRELKDGVPVEDMVLDEPQVIVLDVPNILDVIPRTNEAGGPRPIAPAHDTPRRY